MFLLQTDIFPWDLTILLLMALGISMAVLSVRWFRRSVARSVLSQFLVGCLGFFGCLGFLLTFYGSFIEPHLLVTDRFRVSLPLTLDRPLRIAVLSDIHVGPYTDAGMVKNAVDTANRALPDIVLLPGDFVARPDSDVNALAPLRDLRAPMGVFAIMGNHDIGQFQTLLGKRYAIPERTDALRQMLRSLNITVLENQHKTIDLAGGTLVIVGVDDVWANSSDVGKSLQGIAPDAAVILFSHNPDIILDPRTRRANLIVAGHTHGGQFRLPFIGPIAPIPSRLGRRFDQGVFQLGPARTLAISRGIGTTLARARLFAWPEVMILESR